MSKKTIKRLIYFLFGLAFIELFIGGGVFSSPVKIENVLIRIMGAISFATWWIPLLLGIILFFYLITTNKKK